ncbi:tetratricopeptide repeat-containing sensor histidine kinase, partial [Flavobacterium sp.]|uniref:tetratricopeptide repeat-containing sensor histidine kinase n=1 Tax=Flavobacterium sp. TaxID=239 RepID=UPI003C529128
MVKKCYFYFLLIPVVLFSQNKQFDAVFEKAISVESLKYPKEVDFNKSHSFFIKKEWDSTLYYSMKQLSRPTKGQLNNYCFFMRGKSFHTKKIFKQAYQEYLKVTPDFPFYYAINLKIASLSIEEGKFPKALLLLHALEKDSSKFYYRYIKETVLENLGLCYMHQKKFEKAEHYLLQVEDIREKNNDTLELVRLYINLSTLYYEEYKDDKAIPYFKKAYQFSKKIKSFDLKQNTAINMAVVEENRGDFPLALTYRKEYEQWKDSLNNQDKIWAIGQTEKKFAVEQKQKQVDLLATQNKLREAERNSLLFSSGLLLILLGTGIYFYRQKVKSSKIILQQKIVLDDLNATKDKLFSIVSHDLRSSVNALKSSNAKLQNSLTTKNYEALDTQLSTNNAIANGAYNLLDNLLNWALLQTEQSFFYQENAPLAILVKHVTFNYEPLMLHKSIEFKEVVPSSIYVFIDTDSFKIVLRNLLDNAIKFCPENGNVSVYTRPSEDGYCYLVIEDTGSGMT